ncbi:MAG TPA: hypothetical protein VIK31_12590 [Propionibacteriaceae bacterium]
MINMQEWSPGDDPMLAMLPSEPPWGFQRLPREEQAWRGRAFLIAYVVTGSEAFAWSLALTRDAVAAENNRLDVLHTRDDVIVQGLRDLAEMKANGG